MRNLWLMMVLMSLNMGCLDILLDDFPMGGEQSSDMDVYGDTEDVCDSETEQGVGTGENAVAWHTGSATLTADDFYIEADGTQFFANVAEVDVHSDPGVSNYCTLEVTWFEYGVEMRLYIYFTASDSHWWANEIRTYTGKDTDAEWIYYTGEFFKTELNSTFKGNVDLVSDEENSFKGKIHFENLTLSVRFRS